MKTISWLISTVAFAASGSVGGGGGFGGIGGVPMVDNSVAFAVDRCRQFLRLAEFMRASALRRDAGIRCVVNVKDRAYMQYGLYGTPCKILTFFHYVRRDWLALLSDKRTYQCDETIFMWTLQPVPSIMTSTMMSVVILTF